MADDTPEPPKALPSFTVHGSSLRFEKPADHTPERISDLEIEGLRALYSPKGGHYDYRVLSALVELQTLRLHRREEALVYISQQGQAWEEADRLREREAEAAEIIDTGKTQVFHWAHERPGYDAGDNKAWRGRADRWLSTRRETPADRSAHTVHARNCSCLNDSATCCNPRHCTPLVADSVDGEADATTGVFS